MDSLDIMRANRVAQSAAWESECLTLATKIVQKHGGKGEGGHLIDRLIFLDAKLTQLESQLDPAICRLQLPDGTVPGNIEPNGPLHADRWTDAHAALTRYDAKGGTGG